LIQEEIRPRDQKQNPCR